MYDPICQPRLIEVVGNVLIARCPNGLSPAVECLQSARDCPCGYAEGLSAPHYPVPALNTEIQMLSNETRLIAWPDGKDVGCVGRMKIIWHRNCEPHYI